jgi:hypothetical protein
VVEVVHLIATRKQNFLEEEEEEAEDKYIFPGHAFSDLIPPTRPHLLFFTTSQ